MRNEFSRATENHRILLRILGHGSFVNRRFQEQSRAVVLVQCFARAAGAIFFSWSYMQGKKHEIIIMRRGGGQRNRLPLPIIMGHGAQKGGGVPPCGDYHERGGSRGWKGTPSIPECQGLFSHNLEYLFSFLSSCLANECCRRHTIQK